jgi:large conductance mechanosensitive channel
MALLDDFKKFAFKGNVVDLAVGVIIGTAFGKIVSALVADLVMPLVALVLPSGDWRNNGVVLRQAAMPKDDVVLKWGDFLGTFLDFLLVALVLFVVTSKILQAAEKRFGKPADAVTKECPFCMELVPVKATRCKACTSELKTA